ncbi:hypothetical protein CPB84DRAFT_1844330 [Gymnopilus junonius]|uniref:Uncharacterized protein n=1 Tax=Gymnopilus junonius TaxID=109634 RepID=A0A9P5TRV3_GYMJU|nr:hypothetical protein CPB84DRAFT_1844330 [Gymnopilus junonius]
MPDFLANFNCLDELTQIIYQSIYKFVILSTVSDSAWNIYVGLSGSQGRWWHGAWTKDDIYRIFGPKVSDMLLEAAAEKMADAFIQGEMCISDWSTEKDRKIKLTLGPAAKRPMHVNLLEMSPEDAAAHATSVFIDIALQAQSRKCRLYPSSTDYSSTFQTSRVTLLPKRKEPELGLDDADFSKETKAKASVFTIPESSISTDVQAARDEINSLKSQLENVKRKGTPAKGPVAPPIARPHKGASLANPNKKARKYQAIEFESDDE